jgi:hypothetical protein
MKPYSSSIKVGDGRSLNVDGVGSIKLKVFSSHKKMISLTIEDALYVPTLSTNLISIGKLAKKGYKILFEDEVCKIKLNDKVIVEGVQSKVNNNLYELKQVNDQNFLKPVNDKALSAIEKDKWKLWHHRLGHLGKENMKKLKAEDTVLDNLKNEFCQDCALGKSIKLPHKTVEEKRTNTVIIHSDIAGPMKTESIGKKRYMLTYLCNQTEYSFVYFLRSKNEQFEKFKEFKSQYELQRNLKIQEFRTDNGTEYLSHEFQQYLKDRGIIHNTSVPYCPQSNGKSERLNRTLIDKARCMMIASNVSQNLWTAAVETANYLRNRSPASTLQGNTPYEKLNKCLPKLSHLKIFGCDAYPLDLSRQKSKFEARAKKNCIMIGYGEKDGIYWIYDKENKKIFLSRDVKFDEEPVLNRIEAKYAEFEIKVSEENEEKEEKNDQENHDENSDENHDENSENEEKPNVVDINESENENKETKQEKNDENENQGSEEPIYNENDSDSSLSTKPNQKRIRKQTQKYVPGQYDTQNKFAKHVLI